MESGEDEVDSESEAESSEDEDSGDSSDDGRPWVPDYSSKPAEEYHRNKTSSSPGVTTWYTSQVARRRAKMMAQAQAAVRMRIVLGHHFDEEHAVGNAARRRKHVHNI